MRLKNLLLILVPFLMIAVCFNGDAKAQGSYGSYGGWRVGSVFADGDGYLLPRRDVRVARRVSRAHARAAGYGSADSHSYGSAGSTGSLAPAADEVAPEAPNDSSAEIRELKDLQHRLTDMQREVEIRLAQLESSDRVTVREVSSQRRSSFASAASDVIRASRVPSLEDINPGGGAYLASR